MAQVTEAPADPAPTAADDESVTEELAEVEEATDDEAVEVEAVVVTGQRRRGAALGDIPPEVELNAAEIRALGAGSITELLQTLEPQIRSGRGRGGEAPVILLNGRRISGFSEIRGIPPEAIERFEVLPEEVGLKYGYRADQRVVNIVLRERFRSRNVELEAGGPTSGGRADLEADLGMLRINRRGRSNLDLEYRRQSALLESERDVERTLRGSPFDIVGNIGGARPGAELDPALSALSGRPVTVAGVPASAAAGAPALGDFAATAGAANLTDLGEFRTLLPETERASLNGTLNRTILGDVSATLNARYDLSRSRSLFGLPSATLALGADNPFSPFGQDVLLYRFLERPGPLRRENETDTGHLGLTLDSFVGDWRWSLIANYDRTDSRTETDAGVDLSAVQAGLDARDPALNPFGDLPTATRERDRARSLTQTANAELVVNGTLRELAAGPLATTFRTTLEARDFQSETFRSGVEAGRADLSRQRGAFQANLDIPLASRRREVRTWLGNLSANVNAEVDQLSDFGTLTTLGGGITWSPKEQLNLIASFTDEDGAPSVQQLGDPVLVTPNVPVFDFTRGETVEVLSVDGGNPALRADSRRVLKLGATLRPWEERDLSFSVNYTATRITDPISSFPGATAEIEAAFPERFERDGTGRLVRVDTRPVNFARADRQEIRSGVNWSKPLRPSGAAAGAGGAPRTGMGPAAAPNPGAPTTAGQGAPSGAAPTPPEGLAIQIPGGGRPGGRRAGEGGPRAGGRGQGGGPGGFGRGGGGRFGRPGEGRIQLSLYHTYRLEDSVLIREGLTELDFLDGSAVGSRGGRSRHELDAQAGLFKSGFGAFVNARYQSGTTVIGEEAGVAGDAGDLSFGSLTTVNLRLFADLTQRRELVRRYPFLRGSRVSLAVNNLFDARQDVRDETGAVPISYQPDLLDPTGRSVRITFRKLFVGRPPGARRRAGEAR